MKKRYIITEIIIWTVLLTIVFSLIIFSYSKFFVEPNVYNIQFKDIAGITKGSPVRFMGINVGYVRKLKSNNKHVNVQIILTKKNMKIPNGTVARVEFYGLGGSKSIELMPPDGSCDVGILTDDTIRLVDVAKETVSLVEIIEYIEKFVKGINKTKAQNFLETVVEFNDDKIKNFGKELTTMEKDFEKKMDKIKEKQQEYKKNVQSIDENVDKLNKFIKK